MLWNVLHLAAYAYRRWSIDTIIIVVYFLVTLAIGFCSARRAKSSKEFFVAEKSLPWWVVGFTMVAASISAEQMLGEVGLGTSAGLAVSNWDLAVYPSLLLMVFVFLPLYLRSGVTTIPEYLERRYDRTTRRCFAGYTVFNNACVTLPMILALGATALRYFLGLDPRIGAAILTLFTGVYTVYGGMSSVAWTDTFQCALLLVGGLTVFGVGLSHVPGGWEGLFDRMPQPYLFRGLGDDVLPWPGLIVLALSTNVWYCCTNQFYVQSCLGARNRWHGRMGVLLTAFLGPVLTLCVAFPGYIANDLIGQGLLPTLPLDPAGKPDADATYAHLVNHFLGPGLRGLLIAAVLGAIMSSISSIVNATASVYTIDLHKGWLRPDVSDERLLRVGRVTGLVTLLVAYPLSLVAIDYRFIFLFSQNAWCILAVPIMWVFTLGVLSKRVTATAATATFVATVPFVVIPFYLRDAVRLRLPIVGWNVHLFTFAFGLWIAMGLFMIGASWLTKGPDPAAISSYVWRPGRGTDPGEPPMPWYKSVGFWALIAVLMYAAIYARYGPNWHAS